MQSVSMLSVIMPIVAAPPWKFGKKHKFGIQRILKKKFVDVLEQ
jgi:hypothetical protein